MSDAYFRILERQPEIKEVFRLGNHLVWITPSGTALVIDTSDGKEKLTDEEIEQALRLPRSNRVGQGRVQTSSPTTHKPAHRSRCCGLVRFSIANVNSRSRWPGSR